MEIYNKWIDNYIKNIDLNKIEWICLNGDELDEFYQNNYLDYDEWKYVIDDDRSSYYQSPLGLRYLRFDYNSENYKFLLGVVDNNIGKKTIVAVMIYLDNYYMFEKQKEPFTYVSSIEVNSFFWNRGVFKKLCGEVINFIRREQDIIVSDESEMGRECSVIEKFKISLIENGFEKTIWVDNFSNYSDLYDLINSNNKKIRKIR